MSLKKKPTDKYTKIIASTIMSVEKSPDGLFVVFMRQVPGGNGWATVTMKCTIDAYNTFATGVGREHPNLKYSVTQAHLYNFVMLADKNEQGEDVIVGCHSIPTPSFSSSDMASYLPQQGVNLGLSMEEAVIRVRPTTGEMDVHVVPPRFAQYIATLVNKLAPLEEINDEDMFEFADRRFTVVRIADKNVIFRCEKTSDFNKIVR